MHTTGWSFLGMHLLRWPLWIGLIATADSAVSAVSRSQARSGLRALDILRRTHAAGHVTTEEYERRKAVLERVEALESAAACAITEDGGRPKCQTAA